METAGFLDSLKQVMSILIQEHIAAVSFAQDNLKKCRGLPLNRPFPGLLRQFHRELRTFANLAGDGDAALMRFNHGLHQA